MEKIFKIILITLCLTAVVGCSSLKSDDKQSYPQSPEQTRRDRNGSLTGEGLKLFGGGDDSEASSSAAVGIGINSYLWRATLDTLSFMPLISADPFGGVIITDWYEDSNNKNERFKINVIITSQTLRSDAVKVSVFKQVHKKSGWRDSKTSSAVASELENKILTRARELRINKESKSK